MDMCIRSEYDATPRRNVPMIVRAKERHRTYIMQGLCLL
jgi:hypothetical protein